MSLFEKELDQIYTSGLRRELRCVDVFDNGYCSFNNQKMLNFSSNDYLGLSSDHVLRDDFEQWLKGRGKDVTYGSGSSRLLTGNASMYKMTEDVLKEWYGSEDALFYNSGYHANTGVLPALCTKKDLILSDKFCHASIIDGIRMSSADHIRYRHLDYNQLETILKRKRHLYERVFVVTESVFSMDGDMADLKQLVQLKNQFNILLYVDEAHAVGVLGETGLGLSEEMNVLQDIDILIGTMGKAMSSVGAYVISKQSICQLLVNKSRTLIFTTALPSINMAWSFFVIRRMSNLTNHRHKLKEMVRLCNQSISEMGYPVSQSYIIPIVVGENEAAVQLAGHLQKKGFLIFPIRPPTVPVGTARLRLSLTANINAEDIDRLMQEIQDFIGEEHRALG